MARGLCFAAWALAGSLGAAVCGTGSQVLANGPADKVSFLAAAADPSPAGFESLGFDDSAWAPAVDFPAAWPGPHFGLPWSSYVSSGLSDGDDALLVRRSFSLPPNAIAITAVLELAADDNASIWLNGTAVLSDPPTFISGNATVRTLTISAQALAGANVLAWRIHSPQPTAVGYTFRLTLAYDLECPTATPTFTETPCPTVTPTVTDTPTVTLTPTISPTFSVSPTFTDTATATPTFTVTPTPSVTPTATPTPSITPTATITPTPSVTPTPLFQDSLLSVRGLYPNPFSEQLNLGLGLLEAADLTVTVYNVAGEPVLKRTWALPAGIQVFSLEGRNDAGAALASGVYLLRLQAKAAGGRQEEAWERVAIAR